MDRRIVGFHQDDEQQWVATLDCGHTQHLRHDPPWQERSWVLDPVTRSEHLGTILNLPASATRRRSICLTPRPTRTPNSRIV